MEKAYPDAQAEDLAIIYPEYTRMQQDLTSTTEHISQLQAPFEVSKTKQLVEDESLNHIINRYVSGHAELVKSRMKADESADDFKRELDKTNEELERLRVELAAKDRKNEDL